MTVEQYRNSIAYGIVIEHATYSRKKEKYKSPATRSAEETVEHLQLPIHPGNEEEKDAQRLRSTSTTPRSGRGTDPDDYDRATGISSVQLCEMGMFGDGNATDVEGTDQGVVNDFRRLDQSR